MTNRVKSSSLQGMDDELKIRIASKTDLHPLLELYRHLNGDDPTLQENDASQIFDSLHNYTGSQIFIGEIDDAVVTTCTLIVIPNLTRGGAPYALLENVVTHKQYRKRGMACALLKAAVDSAWSHGCYKVMLLTGSKDLGTLKFYEKAGFTQDKTGFQIRRIPPRK